MLMDIEWAEAMHRSHAEDISCTSAQRLLFC